MSENLKDILQKLWNMGISTIPVRARSKVSAIKWIDYQNRLPTPAELYQMFMRWSWQGNYGVICGRLHGQNAQPGYLTVIDFDDLARAAEWLNTGAPETYMVMTARGMHVYYFTRQEAGITKLPGIDIKRNGYVLGAGCIHPSGAVYHVLQDLPISWIEKIEDVLPDAETKPGREQVQHAQLVIPDPRPAAIDDPWVKAENLSDVVTAIKQRFPILDFFPDAQKSRSDATGRFWVARCPFHDDHNPSLWIDVRGICGCYAGCTPKALDVINLFARLHNMSNEEAIHELAKKL